MIKYLERVVTESVNYFINICYTNYFGVQFAKERVGTSPTGYLEKQNIRQNVNIPPLIEHRLHPHKAQNKAVFRLFAYSLAIHTRPAKSDFNP